MKGPINIVGMVGSMLSILGGLVIIISFRFLPELKTFGNKMIVYVGFANLLFSSVTLMRCIINLHNNDSQEEGGDDWLCEIQGFIVNYSSQCMLIWVTILSFTIHDTVKNRIANMGKRELVFVASGYLIPLFLSLIPFLTNSYGFENGNCWITSKNQSSPLLSYILIWSLFYGPLWICAFVNVVLIIKTLQRLKALEIDTTQTYFVIRRFLLYPAIWILCWLCGTINRLSMMIGSRQNSEFLMSMAVLLTSTQGFFTVIIFLSDKRIFNAIKLKLSRQNFPKSLESLDKSQSAPLASADCFESENALHDEDLLEKARRNNYENNGMRKIPNNGAAPHASNGNPASGGLGDDGQTNQQQQSQNYSGNNNMAQKKKFLKSGQWNRLEMIKEEEDTFDEEIIHQRIKKPSDLFLSKDDTQIIFQYRKIHGANN